MAKDNQGRDLGAVKKHFDMLARLREEGERVSSENFAAMVKVVPLADWTDVEGVLALRCGSSRFVAVPKNGKRTGATFEVIDLDKRELVTVLKKDEVASWLWRTAIAEHENQI